MLLDNKESVNKYFIQRQTRFMCVHVSMQALAFTLLSQVGNHVNEFQTLLLSLTTKDWSPKQLVEHGF